MSSMDSQPPSDLSYGEEPGGAVAYDSASRDSSHPTIMVIDDSFAVRKVIELAFHRVGVTVAAFPDGISAIRALSHSEIAVPSVLLLDLELPRMGGYEVASLLRSHEAFEHTIILVLTGHDSMMHRLHSRFIGARAFIAKPFRVGAVVRQVCGYLDMPAQPPRTADFYGDGGTEP